MKKLMFSILFIFIVATLHSQNTKDNGFIENKGQIIDQEGNLNEKVLYLLNTRGLNVQLRKTGFSYDLYETPKKSKSSNKKHLVSSSLNKNPFFDRQGDKPESQKTKFHRIDVNFLNTSTNVSMEALGEIGYYMNFYTGENPNGVTRVKSFKRVIYHNLYNNIDLEFFVPVDKRKPVEYNFVIHPGGKISDIQMSISGANVNYKSSYLEIETRWGKMNEIIPLSWEEGTVKKNLKINYKRISNSIYGYSFQDTPSNVNAKIVIDPTPVRLWATYYGGEADDTQYNGDIETDSKGNVFLSGYTRSHNNIATTGSFQSTYSNSRGSWAAYLAKFFPDGTLSWATYYGDDSLFRGIAIDKDDKIVGVGETASTSNIATLGTHQPTLYSHADNFEDGFVVKFNTDGIRDWGTFYGGESFDRFIGVAIDGDQNIYAVGETASNENISSTGAFKEIGNLNVHYNWDSFVVKLDTNGKRVWASYYGGTEYDQFIDVGVDSFNNAYIFGTTSSRENIATSGVYQEEYSDEGGFTWNDTFLVKFTPQGDRVWGTYFGGDSYDSAYGLAIDSMDNIIVAGSTRSNVFATTSGAHQSTKEGDFYSYDGILGKFNSDGQIIWNTLYGGNESDAILNVDVDLNNNIFLVGETLSANRIATSDGYQPNQSASSFGFANSEAFFTKFSPEGSIVWGSYYGGEVYWDSGMDIEVTKEGDLYILGYTYGSTDLATSGAHQETYTNEIDNFLVKFKDCLSSITANATTEVCEGGNIEFSASGGVSYSWSGPNGFTSSSENPVITNANESHEGEYTVYIESGSGCDDTKTFEVKVFSMPIANVPFSINACEDVLDSGISTSFDTSTIENQVVNGQTNIVVSYFDSSGNELPNPLPNPMTNSIPNRETITVRIANQNNLGCYVESHFYLVANALPTLLQIDDLIACDDNNDGYGYFDTSNIESDLIGGQSDVSLILFDGNGNELPNPLPNPLVNSIQNTETITARLINDKTKCYSEITFNLIVHPTPEAGMLETLVGCDDNNDGISEYFDVSMVENDVINGQSGVEVSYFDNAGNELLNPLPNPFTNTTPFSQNITVRVTNSTTGCFSETILTLETSSQPSINKPNDLFACDIGDGIGNFDTSQIEVDIIGNQSNLEIFYYDENGNSLPSPLPASFQNTIPYSQTINVRVENLSNPLCYSETSFKMMVNELPEIDLSESYLLCDLEPFLSLSINANYDFYEWSFEDGSIVSNSFTANIENEGNYTVRVFKKSNGINCYNTFSFTLVRSVLPNIESINYGDFGNNFIEIISSGSGHLEYSIDGVNYQDSNFFDDISGGVYTAYVRDKNNCGETSKEITILDYPNFFTPNNDGVNDFWQVKGIQNYPGSSNIYIYNRFGRLIKELSPKSIGWDGTSNGQRVHSNDYWFVIVLNNKTIKGHFALRR